MSVDLARAATLARFLSVAAAYRPALVRSAARLVGDDEAEDMVQDALLRAWLSLETWSCSQGDPDRAMLAWLHTINQNRSRDWLNHVRAVPMEPLDAARHDRSDDETPEAVVLRREAIVEAHEQARRVLAALGRYRSDCAPVVWATCGLEQTNPQAARAMGRHPKAVKAQRYRAVVWARANLAPPA